ncbi:MAG: glycosyltransferase [Candidatus Omnitrophica bacterium]|nr:glycosyltransferase [Candidatus Omnitrophota bacterium]
MREDKQKQDNGPLVSVLTAVYNGEKHIAQCVESVLRQDLRDLEFIVVDDGSSDSTPEILRTYAEKDGRIKYFRNASNEGISLSRNRAFGLSSAPYVAVMDGDDVSLPARLGEQLRFLEEHSEYGGCGTFQQYIDGEGIIMDISEPLQKPGDIGDMLEDPSQISHSTCMFRRGVIESVGGYRKEFKRAVDYDLFLRLQEVTRLCNVPEVLHLHRVHLARGTIRERKRQLGYSQIAKRLAIQRRENGKDVLQKGDAHAFEKMKKEVFGVFGAPSWMEISSNYLYWAHRIYHRGPIGFARRLAAGSIRQNPLNAKAWLYIGFLYLPEKFRAVLVGAKRFFAGTWRKES